MLNKGKLYIIAAPSGAGKTSLVKAMVACSRHVTVSVSHTTRPMRTGEQDGINYHFVSQDAFNELMNQGAFLEHAEVFGHSYGTSEKWVREQMEQGVDVILEIDWQGAQQVRHVMPDAISIFILPPSKEVLRDRLEGRGTDSTDVIEHRMNLAVIEMSHYNEFDYIVINDEFDLALRDLQTILRSRRLSTDWIKHYKEDMIHRLLK